MLTGNPAKQANKYICEKCDFACSKKCNYTTHLATRKHLFNNPLTEKQAQSEVYECKLCCKIYNSRVGLWYHNKKCIEPPKIINTVIETASNQQEELTDKIDDVKNLTSMVLELMKSNSDLQKQMIDVCKNSSNTINNTIISNNNNKTFNLQFFLNEQCKDAMNLTDFTNSFDLQLSDLESVGELGYVDGITKIFVDKLNALDIYKRPIHCSDAKREILYVKDNNIWTKEEKNNPKLRQAIKNVSFTNMKLVYNWSNAYPESKNNESRLGDKYIKLVLQSSGGSGPILESENKIIRRIAKEIVIEKMNN
jgi:hypothetical protein